MTNIDISKLDNVEVFRRLYNNSKLQGMSFLQAVTTDMTYDKATEIFNSHWNNNRGTAYFDYVQGRVMKIKMSETEILSTLGYDRDLGQGACNRVVEAYRKEKN